MTHRFVTQQELVGSLSEAAELSPTDGSLEVGDHDLEEIYTIVVDEDPQPPASPPAFAGDHQQSGSMTEQPADLPEAPIAQHTL